MKKIQFINFLFSLKTYFINGVTYSLNPRLNSKVIYYEWFIKTMKKAYSITLKKISTINSVNHIKIYVSCCEH